MTPEELSEILARESILLTVKNSVGCGCHGCVKDIPRLAAALKEAWSEIKNLKHGYKNMLSFVNKLAEDEGLWATHLDRPVPIEEAYVQQELRQLHAVVESNAREALKEREK